MSLQSHCLHLSRSFKDHVRNHVGLRQAVSANCSENAGKQSAACKFQSAPMISTSAAVISQWPVRTKCALLVPSRQPARDIWPPWPWLLGRLRVGQQSGNVEIELRLSTQVLRAPHGGLRFLSFFRGEPRRANHCPMPNTRLFEERSRTNI